jgi:hypothetical protein
MPEHPGPSCLRKEASQLAHDLSEIHRKLCPGPSGRIGVGGTPLRVPGLTALRSSRYRRLPLRGEATLRVGAGGFSGSGGGRGE